MPAPLDRLRISGAFNGASCLIAKLKKLADQRRDGYQPW